MLHLDGIHAGYGPTRVLHGVSLTVPDRSVVALLGANGAGKSTLMRVASGALAPRSGRVLVDHDDVTDVPPHGRVAHGVCAVPDGRAIFRSLTVHENLELFSHAPGGHPGLLERVLDTFPRLGERLHQTASTMSGGEQQMLALARAYLKQPDVVLLDEVSMGLAPTVVDDIFVILAELAAAGSSLLIVEQYVDRALAVADYAFVLAKGKISFAGEADELVGTDIFATYAGIA